jgi:basic membrane protein A and related proteins
MREHTPCYLKGKNMDKLLKRRRLLILVAVLALLSAACGDDDSASEDSAATSDGEEAAEETPAPAEDGPSLIYVSPNPIGPNPILRLGQEGVDRAAERLGGTSAVYESTDAQSRRSNVEAAVEENPTVIVLMTFDLIELAAEFAAAEPDQSFILVDGCPDDPPANLHCAVFREHEGAYLLGVEAGLLTETGVVGSVTAIDIPFMHRWTDGFAQGAMSVADVEDIQLFIGGERPFADPVRAKEQAIAVAAQGADHIFAVAAAGNGGVFEAATEEGFLTYGVDSNQCPEAPGVVVDNNLKLVDVVINSLIDEILDGTAETFSSFGLADGGISVVALADDVASSGCLIADYPDVIAEVRATADEIIDGTLTVVDPLTAN